MRVLDLSTTTIQLVESDTPLEQAQLAAAGFLVRTAGEPWTRTASISEHSSSGGLLWRRRAGRQARNGAARERPP